MDTEDKRTDAEKAEDKAAEARRNEELNRDPALAARRETAAADRGLEERRGDGRHVVNPRAPEAVARQHEEVDAAKEKRNEENRPGHERNMERIENEANEAQARTAHAHDPRANHVPTGKQQNRNTPRVLTDGTKVWDQ